MNEVIIDENELISVSRDAHELSKILSNESEKLKNSNEDIFTRYMSYSKLRAFVELGDVFFKIVKHSMIAGHNISHPLINTDEAKQRGWDSIKIEEDPFFTTKEEKENDNEVTAHLRNFLTALFNRTHSCDAHKTESPKEEVH